MPLRKLVTSTFLQSPWMKFNCWVLDIFAQEARHLLITLMRVIFQLQCAFWKLLCGVAYASASQVSKNRKTKFFSLTRHHHIHTSAACAAGDPFHHNCSSQSALSACANAKLVSEHTSQPPRGESERDRARRAGARIVHTSGKLKWTSAMSKKGISSRAISHASVRHAESHPCDIMLALFLWVIQPLAPNAKAVYTYGPCLCSAALI